MGYNEGRRGVVGNWEEEKRERHVWGWKNIRIGIPISDFGFKQATVCGTIDCGGCG